MTLWKRLLNALKGGLVKIGLLRGIRDIAQHKDISINEDFYNEIDSWKSLYQGYYKDIHDIEYTTVAKGRQTRRMHTLNMPKVVTEEMASLIFNEKCNISISDETTNDFIEDVLKQNKFNKNFMDYLEYSLAFGGMVVKPYVDNDKIKLSFVTADCFIPISYSNSRIYEGVFINEFRKGEDKYTHLEWHLWEKDVYVVRNDLYKSTNGQDLGTKTNLSDMFPDLEEEVTIQGLSDPLFAYFKPNIANNHDTQSPLGISIFANAIDTIKAIDTAFDSFEREFRLGKKRIIVPAHMVNTVIDENGNPHRYFDSNDELYEAFNFGDMDSDTIQESKIELRVDEHISAINALLNLYAMQTGFSTGTFSFDGASVKTATEIISENSKTFKSKKSHEIIVESGLQELIHSILELAYLYGIYKTPEDYEVIVSFDDSIVEDKLAELTNLIQEVTNKLTPRKQAIMKYHGLTEEEAEKWMQEINEENATTTATDVDFFGTQGQGSDE